MEPGMVKSSGQRGMANHFLYKSVHAFYSAIPENLIALIAPYPLPKKTSIHLLQSRQKIMAYKLTYKLLLID